MSTWIFANLAKLQESEVAEETVEVWKVHFHWTSPWTESTWELRNWFQRTQPAYRPIRNSNTRNLEPIFTKYLEWIAFERSLDLEAAIDCKHSTKWKAWRTKLFSSLTFFKVLLEENQFCLILLPKNNIQNFAMNHFTKVQLMFPQVLGKQPLCSL